MSDYAYVMRPDYNTVNKAKELMQAVKDGKTLSKTDTNITDADRTKICFYAGRPRSLVHEQRKRYPEQLRQQLQLLRQQRLQLFGRLR